MSRHHIILSLDAVAIAVVVLIVLMAGARSGEQRQPLDGRVDYVDLQ